MTFPTIQEILALEPGTIIPGIRGVLLGVGERYPVSGFAEAPMSDGTKRLWSMQPIILAQGEQQIEIEIGNKEPIGQDKKGAGIYFISQQPPQGRLAGVKVDVKDGRKLVRITSKGEMVFGEPARSVAQPAPKPVAASAAVNLAPASVRPAKPSDPSPMASAGWAPIVNSLNGFAQLYGLCQERAAAVAEAAGNVHCDPTRIAAELFRAELAWLRGELPTDLPEGKP